MGLYHAFKKLFRYRAAIFGFLDRTGPFYDTIDYLAVGPTVKNTRGINTYKCKKKYWK